MSNTAECYCRGRGRREKLQPVMWGNRLGTGIFFKDRPAVEDKPPHYTLHLTLLAVTES